MFSSQCSIHAATAGDRPVSVTRPSSRLACSDRNLAATSRRVSPETCRRSRRPPDLAPMLSQACHRPSRPRTMSVPSPVLRLLVIACRSLCPSSVCSWASPPSVPLAVAVDSHAVSVHCCTPESSRWTPWSGNSERHGPAAERRDARSVLPRTGGNPPAPPNRSPAGGQRVKTVLAERWASRLRCPRPHVPALGTDAVLHSCAARSTASRRPDYAPVAVAQEATRRLVRNRL